MEEFRQRLRHLHELLRRSGEQFFANAVEDVLKAPDSDLSAFVQSNDLWGGAGSIADQAFFESPKVLRQQGMRAMVDLGELQISRNIVNQRTAVWTEVFRKWLDQA